MTINDPNRPMGDPLLKRDSMGRKVPTGAPAWLMPSLIALALVLGGVYFMSGPSDRTTTATNSGTITSTAPVPTPAPISGPAPTKAP